MKRIDILQSEKISDLIVENELLIAEYALEKDFIVTEVLVALSKLKNQNFDLVFCGGTCLSKAYGLLDRISEDVDIKVVSKPDVVLSKTATRTALSALKRQVEELLLSVGFRKEDIDVKAKDSNAYMVFNAAYHSHFDLAVGMNQRMKLEFNFTGLSRSAENRSFGLLFDKLAGSAGVSYMTPCVDLTEAIAEKLISFPRRLAMHLADSEGRVLDASLVRHLYDVHQISIRHPGLIGDIALIQSLFLTAMTKDAKDFAAQYDGFLVDPVGEIGKAMSHVSNSPEIKDQYDRFIRAMVYGESPPSFHVALSTFSTLLTSALPAANTTFIQFRPKPPAVVEDAKA